ncbi:efflux transporter periplasmic adaptor subunit, partial [Panacagrimonas perspica]
MIIVALAALAWGLTQRSKTQTTPGAMGGGPPGAGAPGGGGGRGRGGMPTTVGTAKVVQQDIPVILEALGTVTPSETVTVRPQVAGVITDIRFVEGQMVTQGQVL